MKCCAITRVVLNDINGDGGTCCRNAGVFVSRYDRTCKYLQFWLYPAVDVFGGGESVTCGTLTVFVVDPLLVGLVSQWGLNLSLGSL